MEAVGLLPHSDNSLVIWFTSAYLSLTVYSSEWRWLSSAKERFIEFFDLGEVLEGREVEYEPLITGFDITDTGEGNLDGDNKDEDVSKD